MTTRQIVAVGSVLAVLSAGLHGRAPAADAPRLRLAWAANMLTVEAPGLPGGTLPIHYLEAYCRAGSSDRDWAKTVIKHTTRLVSASADGHELALECQLSDGVMVEHLISATADTVAFHLSAHNPTQADSEAYWAQPCIRVAGFTGQTQRDYLPQCFVLVNGRITRLPTQPWATQARYVPGQVYCPAGVDRRDVNPRPLSQIVPSHGLIGCVSRDGKWIMGSAWEPYQELFQGVITCVHADFRIGGLKPGETKQIRGRIYLFHDQPIGVLVNRYEHDFPEHLSAKAK